ncbi:hypothetical protein ABT025_36960 [Streptomyces sp. NPDC002809]|uniref:hypothetical protein n=1 Tax=Streptomyces sp. NPDC002809 TaxID=3154433 RepID=UPI003332FAF7
MSRGLGRIEEPITSEGPLQIEHLRWVMFRRGLLPADGRPGAAIAAVGVALWGILGKLLGVPDRRTSPVRRIESAMRMSLADESRAPGQRDMRITLPAGRQPASTH